MKNLLLPFALLCVVSFSMQSCKKDDTDDNAALKSSIKTTYADIAYASYEDSYNTAADLKTAIDAFVTSPSIANFDAAKTAWKNAREPYGQTEAFRFASGPIDDADGPEGLINAWPLDEVFIDDIISGTDGLTKTYLESRNEDGSEANVSVGYHAIEYLLWGADNSTTGPGQRLFTDYVGLPNSVQARRGTYLKLCAELLVDHLGDLRDEWSSSQTGNYRATFIALDNNTALTNILTGIGVLAASELAGERIQVALDNQDQEDEHSCFSDNTHRDIRLNLEGVQNVYNGSYTRINNLVVSGASLKELINKVDPSLGAAITAQLDAAVARVDATGIPFDQAIINTAQRPAVQEAVTALQDLGDRFIEGGQKLGLTISTEIP